MVKSKTRQAIPATFKLNNNLRLCYIKNWHRGFEVIEMSLEEYFKRKIQELTGIESLDDKVLTKLEKEVEYDARPIDENVEIRFYPWQYRKFLTIEEIEERKERAIAALSRYG